MSVQFLRKSINENVDQDWLRSALNRVDKSRAKRVFNAMLLPKRAYGWGTQSYNALDFGPKSIQYNVDHLIPESMRNPNQPGATEINSLRNLAPLRSNQNRAAKATNCSTKLGINGIYPVELQNNPNYHPYSNWLVHAHATALNAVLDDQALLEPNQNPSIGDDRINFITQHLIERI